MNEDTYLRKYKPEGEDFHYFECAACGKETDGSLLFSEFGICLNCWNKLKYLVPENLKPNLGRIFLYMARKHKQQLLEQKKDEKKFTVIKKEDFKCEGKHIGNKQPTYEGIDRFV